MYTLDTGDTTCQFPELDYIDHIDHRCIGEDNNGYSRGTKDESDVREGVPSQSPQGAHAAILQHSSFRPATL